MDHEELPDPLDGLQVPDDIGALLDDDDRDRDQLPSESGSIQVVTGVDPLLPGAPYICEVRPTDDVALQLPRDRAAAYALAVMTAANQAAYLAAVVDQMAQVLSKRGRGPVTSDIMDNALWVARQLQDDLPEPDPAATAPLLFHAMRQRSTGAAIVRVQLDRGSEVRTLTDWSPADALHHARAVLDVAVMADLDTAYRNLTAKQFGTGEQIGRAIVHELGDYLRRHRPADASPEPEPEPARRPRVPRVPGPPPGARPAGGKAKKRRR